MNFDKLYPQRHETTQMIQDEATQFLKIGTTKNMDETIKIIQEESHIK